MKLSDAISVFPEKLNSNGIIRTFYVDDRVDRIIADNAFKGGIISDKQAVKHDVAVTFYERYLQPGKALVFQRWDYVYSLIYAISENICKERNRKNRTQAVNGVFIDAAGEDNDGEVFKGITLLDLNPSSDMQLVDADFEDRCIDNVDRQAAIEELNRKLENMSKNSLQSLVPGVVQSAKSWPGIAKKSATTRTLDSLPPDHRELNEIRSKLGLTQPDYAVALDLNPATLASYLYGKTVSVPSEIMEAARKLLVAGESKMSELEKKYERSMQSIMQEWCEKLKIAPGNIVDSLADYLQVNSVTIRRWQNGDNRPKLKDLARYDRMVNTIAEKLEKAAF